MDPLEELLLHLGLLCRHELLAVADAAALAGIELDHHELDLLILILGEISLVAVGDQARGDEDLGIVHHDGETAGLNLRDNSLEDFLVVERLFDALAAALLLKALVGDQHLALAVVDLEDLHLKLVTDLHGLGQIHAVIVGVLVFGKNSVCLAADVENDLFRLHVDDRTFDNLSSVWYFERLFQHLFKSQL